MLNKIGTERVKEVIGLIPAAGFAKRISPLPCSKEIYPVSSNPSSDEEGANLRVLSSYLLESMQIAGIEKVYMIIRESKWDIPAYLHKQNSIKVNLAYLIVGATAGVPYTIDAAYPFIKGKKVVFGFPDIMFKPRTVFKDLLLKQQENGYDIVLGLFEAHNPHRRDMVQVGKKNVIQKITIKSEKTDLTFTWIVAVWSPAFTDFMHNFLLKRRKENNGVRAKEIHIGEIIQKAIAAGLRVGSVEFTNGSYLDIGTPENLKKAGEIKF